MSCDALQVVGFREDENHYHYSEYDEYLSDSVLIRQKAGEFTEQMGHTVIESKNGSSESKTDRGRKRKNS